MIGPFQTVPTVPTSEVVGWNASNPQKSGLFPTLVPTVPTYSNIFYIRKAHMAGGAVAPRFSVEHSGNRLEQLERHPNLLELREKNRSNLMEQGMERPEHFLEPDYDLTNLDPRDTAAFWTEALTTDRASMRTRWADYRGKVPAGLAAAIIDDIEAKGAACS